MSSLSTILVELQRLILQESDISTCHSLASTSRSIRPVATEYLYRTIDGSIGIAGWWTCRDVQLLLRNITENPPLASLILTVNWTPTYNPDGGMIGTGYLAGMKFKDADVEIHDQAMGLLQRMQMSDLDSWSEDLKSGSLDPRIALLISQFQCLQELTLAPRLLHKSEYMGRVFTHLVKPRSGYFTRLRSVKFGENRCAFEMAGLNISDEIIMPLLYLPAVEKQDVDAVLSLTPNLKEFQCGFLRERGNRPGSDRVDFSKLCSALRCVSGTLESLKLDIRWVEMDSPLAPEPRWVNPSDLMAASLGLSLAGFDALRHLDVPFVFLTGRPPFYDVELATIIPTGLRTLVLWDPLVVWGNRRNRSPVQYTNLLSDFLQDWQTNAPFLHHVFIDLTRGFPFEWVRLCERSAAEEDHPPEAVQLAALAWGSGVTFVVQYHGP